jgi:uncharacterized protein YukE
MQETILTHAVITSATNSVETYRTSAAALLEQLDGIVNALTANNFNGDASVGYKVFYDQKVRPAIANLTDAQSSLMVSIKSMLEGIEAQMLNTTDPQLGEYNKNPEA